MSASSSPMGLALYFIDVLACLLFCLALALVGARFGREVTVPVDLPRLEGSDALGSDLAGTVIHVRSGSAAPEFYLEEDPVSFESLKRRLAAAPPLSVVVRAEDSAVARVIGAAHAAGIHDIQLAYDVGKGEE